ncbi:MAG: cytidine deaminase [Chloroflexi bacterium]|nr:cytidine deaminase [Chloroflexota bacterium]
MKLNPEQVKKLTEAAIYTRRWAYAPYSHYRVGAALLSSSGKIYEGVNIENAAYPTGICAERVAIFKAVSEGEREFVAIAVATENGGSPCGSCRQVMAEFGLDTQVIIVDEAGRIHLESTVEGLLPGAFTPEDLI